MYIYIYIYTLKLTLILEDLLKSWFPERLEARRVSDSF